jgi:hypothetical protein
MDDPAWQCATSGFVCPIRDLTHVVIITGFTARLNKNIPAIKEKIQRTCGQECDCLFTYDVANTPDLFVPEVTDERQKEAEDVLASTRRFVNPRGSICFNVSQGRGAISFDLIDILSSFEYCNIYSNVTNLHYIKDTYRILVLGYDSSD